MEEVVIEKVCRFVFTVSEMLYCNYIFRSRISGVG
jgi:hypothetical protein